MPTYDYVCRACGAEHEVFQRITARPKRKCPECGKGALERRIGTGAAILFKGSGFYQTDYRSESYTKAQKAESSPPQAKPPAPPADAGGSETSKPSGADS